MNATDLKFCTYLPACHETFFRIFTQYQRLHNNKRFHPKNMPETEFDNSFNFELELQLSLLAYQLKLSNEFGLIENSFVNCEHRHWLSTDI